MKTSWFLLDAGLVDSFKPFDALPIGCVMIRDNKIINSNAYFCDLTGYDILALQNKELNELISIGLNQDLNQIISTNTTITGKQAYLITKNGDRIRVQIAVNSDESNAHLITFTEIAEVEQQSSIVTTMLEKSPNAVIILDRALLVMDHNSKATAFFETVDADLVKNKRLSSHIIDKKVAMAVLSGNAVCLTHSLTATKDVRIQLDPILCEEEVIGVLLLILDKSTEVMLTSELQSQQTMLVSMLELTNSYYIYFDLDYNLIYYNQKSTELYKLINQVDLVQNLNLREIYDEAAFEKRCKLFYDKTLELGEVNRRIEYQGKDKKHYIDITYKVMHDKDNKAIGIIEFGQDVTDSIETHLDLLNSELSKNESVSIINKVIETSPAVYLVYDKDLKLKYSNLAAKEFEQKYGSNNILDGQYIQDVSLTRLLDKDMALNNRILEGCSMDSRELSFVYDKTEVHYKLTITCIKDEVGNIIGLVNSAQDITDQKIEQLTLSDTNATLKAVLESSVDGITAIDEDFNVLAYNNRAYQEFKEYVNVDLAKPITSQVSEKELMRWREGFFGVANSDQPIEKIVRRNNANKVYKNLYTPVKNEEGKVIGALEISRDITTEIKRKEQLESSEKKYKSLVIHSPSGIVRVGVDGLIKDISPRAANIFGYEVSDMIGMDMTVVLEESYLEQHFQNGKKLLDGADQIYYEFNGVRKNKTQVRIEGYGSLVNTSAGAVSTEFLLVFNDVTKRFESEQNLRLVREKFRKELETKTAIYEALIQNSYDGVDIIEYNREGDQIMDGKLVVRNENMKRITPDDKELYDSVEALAAISPEFQNDGQASMEAIRDVILTTMQEGKSQAQHRFIYKDSQHLDVDSSQIFLELEDKLYLIRHYRDITEKVKKDEIIQKQLKILNEKNNEMTKYIESNLQLENFAYIASHDLKAPIRSVISFAQLLRNNVDSQLDEKNAKFLDIIISASTNMQILIDDLLSFSRINTTEVEYEQVNVAELVRRLLLEIHKNISDSNGQVIVNELPTDIVADESRLRQVFQNLIVNGLKFHKPGTSPKVTVSFEDQEDYYEFSVRDEGIGIERKYLSEIFLMFKKLHSENKYKGTGIGLSIAKKVLEQHEGYIRAESVLGEGTSFVFGISKTLLANKNMLPS